MPVGGDPFPIKSVVNGDGNDLTDEKDKDRFTYGRGGDHLMTKFQCDCCHFRNIRGRDPLTRNGSDDMLNGHSKSKPG
jgi:hypothetical protein